MASKRVKRKITRVNPIDVHYKIDEDNGMPTIRIADTRTEWVDGKFTHGAVIEIRDEWDAVGLLNAAREAVKHYRDEAQRKMERLNQALGK